jgi:hypothetical protein
VSQQDAAAQAEGNIALNLILLYRALGGGWQIRLHDGHGASAKVSSDEAGRPSRSPLMFLPGGGPNERLAAPLPGIPALPDALPATETMPRIGPEN